MSSSSSEALDDSSVALALALTAVKVAMAVLLWPCGPFVRKLCFVFVIFIFYIYLLSFSCAVEGFVPLWFGATLYSCLMANTLQPGN